MELNESIFPLFQPNMTVFPAPFNKNLFKLKFFPIFFCQLTVSSATSDLSVRIYFATFPSWLRLKFGNRPLNIMIAFFHYI